MSALIPVWQHTYSQHHSIKPLEEPRKGKGKLRRLLRGDRETRERHFWQQNPCIRFVTTSSCSTFSLGTGSTIFEQVICPLISRTTTELIFVTCFWAESPSLAFLGDALRGLAKKALQQQQQQQQQQKQQSGTPQPRRRIRVRISFSSRSFFQKIFHTRSRHGHTYPPSTWVSKLGLPDPETELLPGLDMTVTSFFWLPFSVMHPKFVVVDREFVALPSCNVSWEEWFEGCVVMTDGDGDGNNHGYGEFYRKYSSGIVEKFVRYAGEGWDMDVNDWGGKMLDGKVNGSMDSSDQSLECDILHSMKTSADDKNGHDKSRVRTPELPLNIALDVDNIQTVFLPSSHHVNPRFRLCRRRKSYHLPPMTALNTFFITAFSFVSSSIYMQTPNLTCRTVLEGLLDALGRGVDVTIVTSERLMVLEQLVTAKRTTKRCVRELVEGYEKVTKRILSRISRAREERLEEGLLVHGNVKIGALKIMFFRSLDDPSASSTSSRVGIARGQEPNPVQSHLKLTIFDRETVVLGSGNMDRASWYTSRELDVAFASEKMAARIMDMLFGNEDSGKRRGGGEGVLKGRLKTYYDSNSR